MKQLTHDLLPLLLMAGIVIATLVAFWKLLDVVVISASIAVVLYPVHVSCSRHLNRYLSAALVTVLVFIIIIAAGSATVSIVSPNRGLLEENVNTIENWVEESSGSPVYGLPVDREQVAGWFETAERLVIDYWNALVSDPVLIGFKVLIFFLSLYLVLLHGAAMYDRFMAQVPTPLKGHVSTMTAVTADTLYAIYIVHAGISVLTFFIAIPVFFLLGYGNVLFYSFLCAFCEVIPVLGSSAVFVFLGVYALAIGDLDGILIIFFLGYVGVSALPEIYIRPVFMARRIKIHPLTMLVGFLGGIITMGMAGFVLGPVFIVLLFTGYKILLEEKKSHRDEETPA